MCEDTISNTQVVLAEFNLQAIKKQLKHPFILFQFSLVPCFKNTNCNNSLNLHTSTFEISYYNIMLFNNISTQISVVLILTLVMASDRYQRYRTFSLSSKRHFHCASSFINIINVFFLTISVLDFCHFSKSLHACQETNIRGSRALSLKLISSG